MLNKAIQELRLENFEVAIKHINAALKINQKNSEALRLLSIAYAMQKDFLKALTPIRKVLKLEPKNALAHSNHGNIHRGLRRYEEAIVSYKLALNFLPTYAEAHNNLGNLFQDLRQYSNSLPHYFNAIDIDPLYAEAHSNLGNAFSKLKKYDEALRYYLRAYKLKPSENFLLGNILHHKMLICDWSDFENLSYQIQQDLHARQKVVEPFGYQGISSSEADLMLAAEIFSSDHFPASTLLSSFPKKNEGDLIKIAYVCGEFRDHATSVLIAGVFECHDKKIFEVFAFDNGSDDFSKLRERVIRSTSKFIGIKNKTTLEVVELVKSLKIDVLINLNGFYGDGRQDIFSQRAAPIQVSYLGFPGTIGAKYYDYLVADTIVIPYSSRQFYTEKIAYLPNCYQANDSKRAISERLFTNRELGLPDEGFVFCCFNNNYKITPNIFDAWMRILVAVPQSVLWLIKDNEKAAENLKLEALKRGVSADRIIFAERLPLPEHLARHRNADLFLDTLPYNAHTTASDALWAGLPLLTCKGTTFPGRVSASLLSALGLPELITTDVAEYEALAIDLARNPQKLEAVKLKLAINITSTPLFDTNSFTKDIESLYLAMVDREKRNLAADDIGISNAL